LKKLNLEKLLLIFIAILPVFDILSFVFRNAFGTSVSISTVIRPLIPIFVIMIIFLKNKIKLKLIIAGLIYAIYAAVHLFIFYKIKTGISYGNIQNELQYLINYTFLILNLFIYLFVFWKKDLINFKKFILISMTIYISSIYIAIITGTSTSTYIEGIGQKGWFESGNSLSSIFILGLFILFTMIKIPKINKIVIPVILLIGIYLAAFLGTRTGLFGFAAVVIIYLFSEIFIYLKNKIKINKKIIISAFSAALVFCLIAVILGSATIQRRNYVNNLNSGIIDPATGKAVHVTLSILELKQKLDKGELSENYISTTAANSITDLYNFANKHEISSTDRRVQQLIYNYYLILNQHNLGLILFGNGFLNNFAELTLEMELPAVLFNFGLIGFTLYIVPFLAIFIYALYIGFKKFKNIDQEYIIISAGCLFTFILAFFTGITFFHSSSMMMVVALNVLLLNKTQDLKTLK